MSSTNVSSAQGRRLEGQHILPCPWTFLSPLRASTNNFRTLYLPWQPEVLVCKVPVSIPGMPTASYRTRSPCALRLSFLLAILKTQWVILAWEATPSALRGCVRVILPPTCSKCPRRTPSKCSALSASPYIPIGLPHLIACASSMSPCFLYSTTNAALA